MTAASPQVLQGMVAVSKDADIEPLGHVCWFSVPVEDVSLNRLRRRWGLAGLDPQPLPRDPRAIDAFKRAVRDEEKVGNYTDPTTHTKVETDVRLIVENEQDVIYQVTRVERDISHLGNNRNARIVYQGAVRVWFSKVTGDVGWKALGEGLTNRDILPIMESIQNRIDANAKTVTGGKVREMVRNYIVNEHDEGWVDEKSGKTFGQQVGLSGEALGGSRKGVYFVLAKNRRHLDSLAEFLHGLYKPEGRAFLYYLPMADGASERELIRRHHRMNAVEDTEAEIAQVRELLKPVNPSDDDARSRAPRENVIKHHAHALDRLRRRAAEYRDALGAEIEDVDTHLEVLNRQMRKLYGI